MRKIKGNELSLTHRFFVFNHDNLLMVSMIAAFDCAAPDAPLIEDEVWKLLAKANGKHVLDEGILKSQAEFLVHGTCHAPGGVPAPAVAVSVRVGGLTKRLIVFGERRWLDESGSQPRISAPVPFASLEMGWDKAYGGKGYRYNPEGKGAARLTLPDGESYLPLPNQENPDDLFTDPDRPPEPACLGYLGSRRFWRGLGFGTYDRKWLAEHWPYHAADLNLDAANCACSDQWYDGYFDGGEEVAITGMSPDPGAFVFRLPRLRARLAMRRQFADRVQYQELTTHCDTALFMPDEGRMVVAWRAMALVSSQGARDVTHLCAAFEPQDDEPLPGEVYFGRIDATLPGADEPAPPPPAPEPASPPPAPAPVPASVPVPAPAAPPPELVPPDFEAVIAKAFRDMGMEPPPQSPPPLEPATLEGLPPEEALARAEGLAAQASGQVAAMLADAGIDPAAIQAIVPAASPAAAESEDLLAALDALRIEDPALKQAVDMLKAVARDVPAAPAAPPPAPERTLAPPPEPAKSPRDVEALMELAGRTGSLSGLDMTGLDFSGRDLSGLDLTGAVLEKAILRGCRLDRADLSGAVLTGADLSQAVCAEARLAGAAASGIKAGAADLRRADLTCTDLTEANLAKAELSGAELSEAVLEGARLAGADLSGCAGRKASFAGADLTGADLSGANFDAADFSKAVLDGAAFARTSAARASFHLVSAKQAGFAGANLSGLKAPSGGDFHGADFSGADLRQAILGACVLDQAKLAGALLDRADLRACSLRGADLGLASAKHAVFDETDLEGANLTGVNGFKSSLREAGLHRADLRDANFYSADFFQARFHETELAGTNLKRTVLALWRKVKL